MRELYFVKFKTLVRVILRLVNVEEREIMMRNRSKKIETINKKE